MALNGLESLYGLDMRRSEEMTAKDIMETNMNVVPCQTTVSVFVFFFLASLLRQDLVCMSENNCQADIVKCRTLKSSTPSCLDALGHAGVVVYSFTLSVRTLPSVLDPVTLQLVAVRYYMTCCCRC